MNKVMKILAVLCFISMIGLLLTGCDTEEYVTKAEYDEMMDRIEEGFAEMDDEDVIFVHSIDDLEDRVLYLEQGTEHLANIIMAETLIQERFEEVDDMLDELDRRFLFIYTEDEIDEWFDMVEEWGTDLEDTVDALVEEEPDHELQILYVEVALIDILIYQYDNMDPADLTEEDQLMYDILLLQRAELINEIEGGLQ